MNDATYVITLDSDGVVSVDGLLPSGEESLKLSVERGIKYHKLPLLKALGRAIGPYATATELDTETTVSDLV